MGGRGTWAQRNKSSSTSRSVTASGGGGGDSVNLNQGVASGSGIADVGDLNKIEVVSMNWRGDTHEPADNLKGKLVIRDSKGRLHESTLSSAGSARITFEFKDFVLKFEGFHSKSNQGQNAAEMKAYNALPKAGQRYVPKPLSSNKQITVKFNGRAAKTGNMIALERATPLARSLTPREYRSAYKVFRVFQNNKGNFISDLRFPGAHSSNGIGHNVFIVAGKKGRPSFKAVDIPYNLIR